MFHKRHQTCGESRVKVAGLNNHLTCVLCGGYYIDATTILECLHSFCKTCIIQYIESSDYCPVCDVLIHETRAELGLMPDNTLQGLVYKMVPGLFTNEMKRRREFQSHTLSIHHGDSGIESSEGDDSYFTEEEKISLVLEFSTDGKPPKSRCRHREKNLPPKRYLLCPAPVTIKTIKKFIRLKFELADEYMVDVFHTEEPLSDHYTLMDVAYIYSWMRTGPMRLFYCIYKRAPGHSASFPIKIEPDDSSYVPNSDDSTHHSQSETETDYSTSSREGSRQNIEPEGEMDYVVCSRGHKRKRTDHAGLLKRFKSNIYSHRPPLTSTPLGSPVISPIKEEPLDDPQQSSDVELERFQPLLSITGNEPQPRRHAHVSTSDLSTPVPDDNPSIIPRIPVSINLKSHNIDLSEIIKRNSSASSGPDHGQYSSLEDYNSESESDANDPDFVLPGTYRRTYAKRGRPVGSKNKMKYRFNFFNVSQRPSWKHWHHSRAGFKKYYQK